MVNNLRPYLLFFYLFILNSAVAQNIVCPPNIDFEYGNFSGWECRTGVVNLDANGQNNLQLTTIGVLPNRHTIIPVSSTGLDPYGGFPQHCPNGSGYSIKLGNSDAGAQAESVSYTYAVPANTSQFIILYQYAVVFQDPPSTSNHETQEKPRFQARVVDVATNTRLGCVSFDFYSSNALPGFQVSPLSTPSDTILYKDWTPITIDLTPFAGKTIRVEFITSDCTRGGHFGYAYVDVNANCKSLVRGASICDGEPQITLTAPYGYAGYQWFGDMGFTMPLGTNPVLTINPAPPSGTRIPLILQPYPGYGCTDTIYTTITANPRPPSIAGPDQIMCNNKPVQLGGAPTASCIYQWSPAIAVDAVTSAQPHTLPMAVPTQFIVETTDLATGCVSTDTTLITPQNVDTAMTVTGPLQYCQGDPLSTSFTLRATGTRIQWLNNFLTIPAANGAVYAPNVTGNYRALLNKSGCIDTTRNISFFVYDKPVADFSITPAIQCITANQFPVQNLSHIADATALSHAWNWGDGNTSVLTQPMHTYAGTGNYLITLRSTSMHGCFSEIQRPVTVTPNVEPAFRADSNCTGGPVHFLNLSQEHGLQPITYNWDFGNGNMFTGAVPPPQHFTPNQFYNVTLHAWAPGCLARPQQVTQVLGVHLAAAGVRYPDITAALDYGKQISARTGIGDQYRWRPATFLSDTSVRTPVFTAGTDTRYTIAIRDSYGCIITDTLQVNVLSKKGVYMPTGFTPNHDGLNETIRPYLIADGTIRRFSIFNRNGELVFSTAVKGAGWDGTFRGTEQATGVYVWQLEYTDAAGIKRTDKGLFTLIR